MIDNISWNTMFELVHEHDRVCAHLLRNADRFSDEQRDALVNYIASIERGDLYYKAADNHEADLLKECMEMDVTRHFGSLSVNSHVLSCYMVTLGNEKYFTGLSLTELLEELNAKAVTE